MRSSGARSVEQYLAELPPERGAALSELRRLILEHLPAGYEESMQYGMISYVIPLSRYADTYNGQPLSILSIASQKNYMALYLMTVYGDAARERALSAAFRAAGKKLDMGKSCVRFRSIDDLALPAIAEVVASTGVDEFIVRYEVSRSAPRPKRAGRAGKKGKVGTTSRMGKTKAKKKAKRRAV